MEQSVRILSFLVSTQGVRASADTIAEVTGISPAVVRQLMQTLGRAELVASVSGPSGGYWLSCVPAETNMLTVTEACEGPINPMFCDLKGIPCGRVNQCILHIIWCASQKALALELSKTSLAAVVAATPE
jgi:Rrf2 family iron-sulfur cluster assembly transcriptional regulator